METKIRTASSLFVFRRHFISRILISTFETRNVIRPSCDIFTQEIIYLSLFSFEVIIVLEYLKMHLKIKLRKLSQCFDCSYRTIVFMLIVFKEEVENSTSMVERTWTNGFVYVQGIRFVEMPTYLNERFTHFDFYNNAFH